MKSSRDSDNVGKAYRNIANITVEDSMHTRLEIAIFGQKSW